MADPGRFGRIPRFETEPTFQDVLRTVLDDAIRRAEATSPDGVNALDAGCGRKSPLRQFRDRLARFVGTDIHPPARPIPYLDEFVQADLCGAVDGFEPAAFDIIVSNFTLEHFANPTVALTNLRHWLRPGGTLVATTVNRGHPFVAAYLGMPSRLRSRLQPLLKQSAADAHALVGACNDAATIRADLATAGYEEVALHAVSNLAVAWSRNPVAHAIGRLGDLLTRATPARRSTFVIVARAPA